MNNPYSQQILDSLLEEYLTGTHPPDLSARIQAAWRQERQAVSAPLVQATLAEMDQEQNVERHVCVSPVSPAQPSTPLPKALTARRRIAKRAPWQPAWLVLAAATAACGLLLLLPSGFQRFAQPGPNSSNSPQALDADASTLNSSTSAVADSAEGAPSLAVSPPEVLELDNLPFTTTSPEIESTDQFASNALLPSRLPADQVVAEFDRRLQVIWEEAQVTPTPRMSNEQLAQRVSMVLTDQRLSDREVQTFAATQQQIDLRPLIERAITSNAFSRVWAEQLTRTWLARSELAEDDPRIADLKQIITMHLRQRKPWSEIPQLLLGGDVESYSSPTQTFFAAMAGDGNHRLIERVGESFLDVNLACVRCHDSSREALVADRQELYWSLVALFKGVDASGRRGERVATDRQFQLVDSGEPLFVYFDLLDGRLQAAEPRLPSGLDWRMEADVDIPRQALANWLARSPELDRALVNQVWKLIFARPLLPQVNATERASLAERRQLQDFLASQFRAHGQSVDLLVSWIVQSEAFARSRAELSRSQWLNASDEELQSMQRAKELFAAGVDVTGPLPTLDRALRTVLQLRARPVGAADARATLLAQPTPEPSLGGKGSKPPRSAEVRSSANLPAEMDDSWLHGRLHTDAEIAYVRRLLQSERLSWEQRVEHIVRLSPRHIANGRVQQLAGELLQSSRGEAEAALLDLLWAVEISMN